MRLGHPFMFGAKKVTWTIVANGQTTAVPASLDPLWEVSPFVEASGNTPPTIRFESGASVQGPRPISATLSTAVGNPLTLALWLSDDAKTILGMKPPKTPPVVLTWSKFRGPGVVTFSDGKPAVELAKVEAGGGGVSGTASTSATFIEPGEYILLTNAQVRVSVKP
jgi:hypothetical protein